MKTTRLFHIFFYSVFSFCLTNCVLYQKPIVPKLTLPHHFKETIHNANPHHCSMNSKWWENFNDSTLTYLVELALKNNDVYQSALKNIQIADTYITQNESGYYPSLNLDFNSSRNKSTNTAFWGIRNNPTLNSNAVFNLQQLSGSISYQLDVWGQIRNSVNQAKANKSMSEANSNAVKLTLLSAIIGTYFQLLTLNTHRQIYIQQYAIAKQLVDLSQTQFISGLIDASSLDAAKNQAENILITLNNIQKEKSILEYTLAALAGEYPESFIQHLNTNKNLSAAQLNNMIPAGLPSEMIANRPDILAAFQEILSYGYLEKQTIANFLPSISLTGNYGYASTSLSHLMTAGNSYWAYGLSATQYIFDFQTRISEYKRSKLQYESAILNYKNTVINAFKEVDSALVSYSEDHQQLLAYQREAQNTKDILQHIHAQYKAGLIDDSGYLSAKSNYLLLQYNLINQQLKVIQDIVQVYSSLGQGV